MSTINLFFVVLNIGAATPTMEGLFRNARSANVSAFTQLDLQVMDGKLTSYLRIVFGEGEFLQKTYMNEKIDDTNLSQVLWRNTNELSAYDNRNLFYSLLYMWSLNDSSFVGKQLKARDSNFEFNNDVMNKEKIALIRSEISNLKREGGKSILNSEDAARKSQAEQVFNTPTYKPSQYLKLVKDGANLFWFLDLSRIKAFFTNEEHFLMKLEVNGFNLLVKEYTTFEKKYFLPGELTIKSKNSEYQVKIVGMRTYSRSDSLQNEFTKLKDSTKGKINSVDIIY